MGLIISLAVSALAGYLGGTLMGIKGPWYINIILGLLGGIVGSVVLGIIGISSSNIIGSIIISVIGACIVIAIYRAIKK